jgi:hypothetical protein
MRENTDLKNDDSKKKESIPNIFCKCIYETLLSRIFSLSYPISLYFLDEENLFFTFYITLGIILLSIIYFICYFYFEIKKYDRTETTKIVFYAKRILYVILGYLVQYNLYYFDINPLEGGGSNINFFLCILKIFMLIEMLKRVYFYNVAIIIIFNSFAIDSCLSTMSLEIAYYNLWYNYYSNQNLLGFEINILLKVFGSILAFINGIFLLAGFKKCLIIHNLCYLSAHVFTFIGGM